MQRSGEEACLYSHDIPVTVFTADLRGLRGSSTLRAVAPSRRAAHQPP
jgi:hypothetical protein